MAKGDDKRVRNNITEGQDRSNTQYDQLNQQYTQSLGQKQAAGDTERANILGGYSGLLSGGISEEQAARLRSYATPGGVSTNPSGGQSSSGSSSGGVDTGGLYSVPQAGYSEFANTGGVDLGKLEESLPIFRELGGSTGGFDPERLARLNSSIQGLKNIGDTGGIDPEQLNALRGTIGDLRNYGKTGGLTPEEIARFRDPGYEEYAQTGGWDPQRMSMYRSNALAPAQSLAASYKKEIDRASRVNPGGGAYAAALASASRRGAQGVGDVSLQAENDLSSAIDKGRQWGIAGRAAQEAALGGLLSQNRISATNAAASQGGTLENNLAQNKLAGLKSSADTDVSTQGLINNTRLGAAKGITDTNYGAQSLVQGGRLAGLNGLTGIAGMQSADAARAAALAEQSREFDSTQDLNNRQFGAGIEQYLMNTGDANRLAGLTGMQQMYGQTYAPESEMLKYQLTGVDNQTNANQGWAGQRTAASQIPGAWQTGFNNVIQGANAVAGLVGGFSGTGGTAAPVYRQSPTPIPLPINRPQTVPLEG